MSANPRCGAALVMLLVVLAAAQAASAQPPPAQTVASCDEDAPAGEPPTISSRFDLKDAGEGIAFTAARARALDYCARQTCTIDGKSKTRQASIYALGMLHRRYVAGFRCVPSDGAPAEKSAGPPLAYPLQDPSGIDAARADANTQCAAVHAKAELADLRKNGDGFIAVFACGS
jgi:hypothetical protein